MMQVGEAGLALIRQFEGLALTPYRCPAGLLTIGYGHVLRGPVLPSITPTQAEELLLQDAAIAAHAVRHLLPVALQPYQFDALVSFTFNLGSGALQRSTLRRRILEGQHAAVPTELMRWVHANGRKLPGLIRRRAAEAALYQGFSAGHVS